MLRFTCAHWHAVIHSELVAGNLSPAQQKRELQNLRATSAVWGSVVFFENRCTSERVQRKINGLCPQEQLARRAASAARVLLEARRRSTDSRSEEILNSFLGKYRMIALRLLSVGQADVAPCQCF